MKLSRLIAATLLSVASFAANATILTQTAAQTSGGHDFSFVFNGLSTSFVGGGKLTFIARGDYSSTWSGVGNPLEVIMGSAEGMDFGPLGYDDADTSTSNSFDDNEWTKSISLSHADLTALLADGMLNVNAFLTSNVDLFSPDTAFAGVSFEYTPGAAVPEPATLGLFGLALAGFGAVRRRRK